MRPMLLSDVICVVAAKGDEVGVQKLLEAEGFDPENGDLAIIERFVSQAGQEPWSGPRCVLSR